MSIVTMIGVEANQETVIAVEQSLRNCRFVPISATADSDPLSAPVRTYALSVAPEISWWVAIERDLVDLDRVYDISAQIRQHCFDGFCLLASERPDVLRVAFLFLDLGNDELEREQLESPRRLLEWIEERMAGGGPTTSLLAWTHK